MPTTRKLIAVTLAITCLLVGAGLCVAGGLAAHIGLGDGSQFVFYRALGLARHRTVELGVVGIIIGLGALLMLILSPQAKANIAQVLWRAGLAVGDMVRERIAIGKARGAVSGDPFSGPLDRLLQTGAAILAFGTTVLIAISLLWGFDITDEGLYLYEMTQRQPAARFFLSPVAGAFGSLFQNNILCWRYIGLALLATGATLFALAIARLAEWLKLLEASRRWRMLLVCAGLSGSMAFFAYGPPTFSYRLASSAGVLFVFAGVIFAVLAGRGQKSLAWNLAASFAVMIMTLARPPALPPYLLSLLLLGAILLPVCGWRILVRVGAWHAGLTAAMGGALLLPMSLRAEFVAIAERLRVAEGGGYRPSIILSQHLADLWALPHSALVLTGEALMVGAGIALFAFGIRLLVRASAAKFYGIDIVLWAYAVLPFFLVVRYFQALPSAVAAGVQCADMDVLACQGPTPAQTGRDFIEVMVAQLLLMIILLLMDRLAARQSRSALSGGVRSWGLLMLFLAGVTLGPSFYTDVGWFYHSILSLTPLALCLVLAPALLPLRRLAIPIWPIMIALLGFQAAVAADAFHNRVLFPHRQLGGPGPQTQPLSDPAALRGLRVAPQTLSMLAQVTAALRRGGFEPGRDLVVAPYNMPGVLVMLQARALGTPWYERLPVDCAFLEADHSDLHRPGPVYMISDAAIAKPLASCLAGRGLDFAHERKLGTVRVDERRSINIFVVRVR